MPEDPMESISARNDLGGLESEPVGLAVTFHKAHESVPLLGRVHDVLGFDRLGLSVGKSCVDVRGGDLSLGVDHEHPRDFARLRCAGIKDIRAVKGKGGNSAGSVPGACELDVGDALLVQASDELNASVQLRCRTRRGGKGGKGAREGGGGDQEACGEHGLHCGTVTNLLAKGGKVG